MARTLAVLTGILATLFVAAVLYLSFADLSRFQPQIETLLGRVVGREVRIAGDLEIDVLPRPSFSASQITLANAEWAGPEPMVSVGRVAVEIGLWSVVFGPVRVRSLELHDVEVLLEHNDAGEANWTMAAQEQPSAPEPNRDGADLGAIVERASIRNVSVVLRRPESPELVLLLAELELSTSDEGSLAIEGAGRLAGVSFDINADLDPRSGLGSAGMQASSEDAAELLDLLESPVELAGPLRIDLDVVREARDRTTINVDAVVADISIQGSITVGGETIDFSGVIGPLDQLGAVFAVEGLPQEPVEIDGSLVVDGGRYELRDTSLRVLAAEAMLAGALGIDPETPTELEIAVTATSLADLEPVLPALPLTATARVRASRDSIDIDALDAKIGDSAFSGALRLELGDAVALVAKGELSLLDLTPLQTPAAEPAAEPPASDAVLAAEEPPSDDWVFGEETLPFNALTSATVDVELAIGEIRQGNLAAKNVVLALQAAGGMFDLATSFEAPHGGSAEGRVTLASGVGSADLALDFDFRDLRLNLMSGEIDNLSQIPPLGLSVDVRSSGNSLRALASASNGRVVATQGRGRVDNQAVGVMTGDIVAQLFGALNPFAAEEPYTSWECTVLALSLTNGVGELSMFLAQSEKLQIVGGGTIDLTTETLNIEFNTKPRSGVGVTADMFVTPFVKLGGTFAEPGVGVNSSGVLLSGTAAVLTGGLSFLVRGLTDRATAQADQCAAALAAVESPAEPTAN